jgi:hypothetical protein
MLIRDIHKVIVHEHTLIKKKIVHEHMIPAYV